VARRLALLSAELATVRPAAGEREDDSGADVRVARPAWPQQLHDGAPTGAGGWEWGEHTRVRSVPDPAPLPAPAAAPAPVPVTSTVSPSESARVRVPGRHAARRAAALVPAGLRGRVALTPAHLAVVSVAVAFALAWCCWWLVRDQAAPVVSPVVSVSTDGATPTPLVVEPSGSSGTPAGANGLGGPGGADPTAGGAAQGTGATVTVDVAGKVRRPGIAILPAGSRVVDALESAGGARRGVDLTALNLARPLIDGEQVLVGVRAVAGLPGAPAVPQSTAGASGAPAALVNINTADQVTLESLPGIGPVTAGAIIGWRTENGGFSSVGELLEVDGIGEATLGQLTPLVTL
jgi:competence protein ComEA